MRFTRGSAAVYPQRHEWDQDSAYWQRVRQSAGAIPPGTYPTLQSFGDDFPEFTQEQAFEFGLDLILKGIP